MKVTFNVYPHSPEEETIILPLNPAAIDTSITTAGEVVELYYTDEEFANEFHSLICVGDDGDLAGDPCYYDYDRGENCYLPIYEYDRKKTEISFLVDFDPLSRSGEPFVTMAVNFNDPKMEDIEAAIDAPKIWLDESELKAILLAVDEVLNNKQTDKTDSPILYKEPAGLSNDLTGEQIMTTTTNENIITFTNVYDLCDDMDKNFQTFIFPCTEDQYADVFRLVEINNCEGLVFFGNRFLGGAYREYENKLLSATRHNLSQKHVSEYSLIFEDCNSPVVFRAVEKYGSVC